MKKLVLLWVVLAITPVFAQNTGLTPWDIAVIKNVSSVVISEDGSKIAYTLTEPADPVKENSLPSSRLWVYDLVTQSNIPFIPRGSVMGVSFRPGHKTITFLARRDGDVQLCLYEIPLAGGEAVKLYEHTGSIQSYEWSSDGKSFVFLAAQRTGKRSTLPYEPIFYEENLPLTRLFVASPGEPARMAETLTGSCEKARWSPDGRKIAVSASPTSLVDDTYMKKKIHILDVQSLAVIAIIDHSAKLGDFAWSSDSKQLAMIAGADIHDPTDGRLIVADVSSGKVVNVVPDFKGKFEKISWVDDKTIRFLASEGVFTTLATIGANGKNHKRIVDKGSIIFTDMSATKDGKTALVGSTALHPGELFFYDGKNTRKLTNSNPWIAERTMGKQDVIRYKAQDGLELEGLLILPVDYRQGTRYPLITVVHGGPEAHYSNGWLSGYSMPGQVASAGGYAVFYPNYRGSTGRNEEFAKSSQEDPAGKEFDDVIDGIDYLIDAGIADKSRVGVTGGSYGGYATAWMSTRYTDRFAAGVMFVGISNNLSKWGTSDIPEEMYLVHHRMRIWDDYEFFLKRSPIYYAGQAKTPLLIMTGAGDTRVDPGQSKELYRHIKTRTDTPVRLVLYPGEGHGNRSSTSRLDYNLRMMQWFDNYLLKSGSNIPDLELKID